MGISFGPRIPQVTSTLVLLDPANSAGIINPYTNLITSPEDLSVWTPSNLTVTLNAVSAPDGTITADSVYDNTTLATHSVTRSITTTIGVTYTVSIFAKAGTLNQFAIIIDGNLYGRLYRLSNGTTGAVGSTPTSWALSQLNDGWYRASLTYVATSSSTSVAIWTATNDVTNYAGSGGGYLHLWGLQLTATSTLQDYTAQSRISNVNQLKDLSTPLSTVVNSVSINTNTVQGQAEYTTPGLYNWQCPSNVTSVSVLCIGGGGGGGGGSSNAGGGAGGNLRYRNNISVTPGQNYQVFVGAGGARGVSSNTNGEPGSLSSFAGLVVAQGGGAGTTVGGKTTTGGNAGTGSNGGAGGITDGGGGGAGGYVFTSTGGAVVQVSATQFDATSLGPVISVDQIGSHYSATVMASSGFLKYTLATSAGNQQIVVSYRKTGTTISQSAWTLNNDQVNYTSGITSILFYLNDDHDTLWIDADGSGIISRINTSSLGNNFDKFRATTELINNAPLDSVTTYPTLAYVGGAATIVSFPLTNSSIIINLTSSTYKVNNGSVSALPSPLSGIGTSLPQNSIITISDGVNQFLIYRYNTTNAYLCTVDLTTRTVTATSVTVTSRAPNGVNQTEEDALGDTLYTVDGTLNWLESTVYYYGGTLDWKTNTNPFNTSGKSTFSAGTINTQTGLDIWGSIDSNGFVWFADWGHDDGGLFNIGNDSQLNTRQTNIKYCSSFISGDFVGTGGGAGGNQGGSAPGVGIGGGGGGGGGGSGGAGGGGVGIYGQGSNGVAGVTKASLTDGIQQGGGGSSGTGGAVKNQGADLTAQTGGLYGGGGGGGFGGGPGGNGAVRIIWGPGRSYPLSAADVVTSTGSLSATAKLDSVITLTSTVSYNSGYLEFAGTTASYGSISNVESADYITVTAAVFVSNWTTASGVILSNADTDGTNRYIIDVNGLSAGNLAVTFNSRAGNVTATYARSSIAAGWHIVTAVFDGASAYLYIDGVIASSTAASSTTVLNPPGGYNTTTLAAKLTGSVASSPLACRIGYLNITASAYSAADALTAYTNVRGRYGI